MPVSTEALKQDLDQLTRDQHRRVVLDPTQLADLFTEFADEDRALAEAGMSDYAAMLYQED
jgi:hypothetical protein